MGWLQGIMKNVNLIMFFFTEVTICFFCRENQFYCEREVVTRYCSIYNNLHVRFTNKITSGPPVINDSFNVILFTSVQIFESLILLNFEIWTELGHWVIKCKISLVVYILPEIINFHLDTWCGVVWWSSNVEVMCGVTCPVCPNIESIWRLDKG